MRIYPVGKVIAGAILFSPFLLYRYLLLFGISKGR